MLLKTTLKGKDMSSNEFTVGSTVMLKSGGPRMIVEEYDDTPARERVKCAWFDTSNTLHRATFMPATLEHDDEE